jgi:photosystem II stability/assembly factor-like uncharacterized protein
MLGKWPSILILSLVFLLVNADLAYAHVPHDVIRSLGIVQFSNTYLTITTILYVIARDSLLRSIDGGFSWKNLVKGLVNKHRFSSIAISPSFESSKVLYVSSEGDGVFKSQNGGDSWLSANNGLSDLRIGLLSTPWSADPDKLVLAAGSHGGLFRTEDGGSSWHRAAGINNKVTAISFFPDRNEWILIGDRSSSLHLSTDGGLTWKRVRNFGRGAVRAIAISPNYSSDGTFFVGTEKGSLFKKGCIYKSDDLGQSFDKLDLDLSDAGVTSLAISPDYKVDLTLFACTWREAVFRTSDSGTTWEKCSQGVTTVPESKLGRPRADFRHLRVSESFKKDRTIYLAGFDGLLRSTDGGDTWMNMETISVKYIDGLAVSPNHSHDATVAFNTYSAGIYVTENRGITWRVANRGLSGMRGLDIAFSPNYSSDCTIFAANRIGACSVLKSEDKGSTWNASRLSGTQQERWFPNPSLMTWIPARMRNVLFSRKSFEPLVIAVSPDYAVDGTVYAGGMNGHIFRSTDGGLTFTCIRKGGLRGAVKSLAISPNFSSDKMIFASIGTFDLSRVTTSVLGIRIKSKDAVLRTSDGGETWQPAGRGLPLTHGTGIRLAISPKFETDRTVFAATAEGLFRTNDRGDSWDKTGGRPGYGRDSYIEAIAISPNYVKDGEILVSVRGMGLFKSIDGGETFNQVGHDLINDNHSLCHMFGFAGFGIPLWFSPTYAVDNTIYGTSSEELFISTDRGITWTMIKRPVRYEDIEHTRKTLRFKPVHDWQVRQSQELSMSCATCSSTAGSRAVFRFVGTGVRLIGSRGGDQGIARVYIDGEFRALVDQYSSSYESMLELYLIEDLVHGPHTAVVEVTGTQNPKSRSPRIEIDAFDVLN